MTRTPKDKVPPNTVTLPHLCDPRGVTVHLSLARALLTFASVDPNRGQLAGIGVDVDSAGSLWLQATDGCTLARSRIEGSPPHSMGGRPLWGSMLVVRLMAEAKADKAHAIILGWDQPDKAITTPPGHATMPSYGIEEGAAAALDGIYLERLGKLANTIAMADRTNPVGVILRSYNGAYDPSRYDVFINGRTIVEVVIMPCRLILPGTSAMPSVPRRAKRFA